MIFNVMNALNIISRDDYYKNFKWLKERCSVLRSGEIMLKDFINKIYISSFLDFS